MTYYEKYNVVVVLIALIGVLSILFLIFKKNISSLIDPIVFHFIWCASCTALLIGYVYKHGISSSVIIFILSFVLYILFLWFFLKNSSNRKIDIKNYESISKIESLYLLALVLTIYSKVDFIIFAYNKTPIEWFLYRFYALEGRDPLQFIFKIGASPFFFYFSFVLLAKKHKWKRWIVLALIINLITDILSGGRSSTLTFIFGIGAFILKCQFESKTLSRKVNFYGAFMIAFSLVLAIIVSSFYSRDSNLTDGILIIFDRIISAGDGLDIYLTNNAERYLDTGLLAYLKSAFGIFLGQLFGVSTKSVGWRLYEIDSGLDIDVAAGPNYIMPLQIAVLGYWYIVPYTLFCAYIVAKLRSTLIKGKAGNAFSYAMSYNCFTLITDVEYAILVYVSIIFVYIFFMYPLSRFKLDTKIKINFFKLHKLKE
ncbi:hypothetical protein GCM10027341_38470 [Spirosoma knui]